uniref:proton channel OTOP3 n=1 Tax=Podarcis muralis TaxID=64176 RepID=UPI00109F5542|nr:proton channel OTOP3 [Podarcis muralis]XP_028572659.1 proton channel OTOP3 [Podarcis muralis]XP_028572660.1 proton channel OTOP3 [Podarcis muralis]
MDIKATARQRHHPQEAGEDETASPNPEGWKINYEKSWLHRHCSSLLLRDKQAQKAGRLFSGLMAMNVVFLGSAFICSMIFNKVVITLEDVWIFLSILKVLALGWMASYLLFTRRKPHAILYRDAHAGPMWVKGSLILFGACSVLLHMFRIGYNIIHIQCKSQVALLFPSIGILFICIQTYFIWCHAKDCTQVHHNFTRCGLMLTLAINLLLWLLAVTDDSVHKEIESEQNNTIQRYEGNGTSSCRCSNKTGCKVFQNGYILLYPFNTEYCLICCSMLYVMWKNVGRRIAQHHSTCAKPRFKPHGVIFGPLLGIFAVITGICIFMVYQVQATSSSPSHQAFILYYSYYIVLLPVMTLGALIGTITHGLEERELDTLKNPTRSLDVILLMGAALGQIGISYFSIVAIVATDPTDLLNSIILAYSVSLIIQHITQNIFIIEGLHRQPLPANEGRSQAEHSRNGSASTQSPPSEDMIASPGCREPVSSAANKEADPNEGEKCEHASVPKVCNPERRQDIRKASQTYIQTYSHLNWKRKALKEISSFLIMCNIILWIMPSFGAHPVFENGIEKSFYGYSTWFVIVNFGLPLGVFYRMHSVGDLLEVYRSA